MAKRGSKHPPSHPSYLEEADASPVQAPRFTEPTTASKPRPPFGLGVAALTWRDRIAALGVERRAREIAFLDDAIAERTDSLRNAKKSLADTRAEVAKAEMDRDQRSAECHEIESRIAARLEELANVDALIAARHEAARQADEAAAAQALRASVLTEEFREGEDRLAQLQQRLATADSACQALEAAEQRLRDVEYEANEVRERMVREERKIREAADALEDLNLHIDRARIECESSQAEQLLQRGMQEELRAELETQELSLQTLARQTHSVREHLDNLTGERQRTQEELARLASDRGRMEDEASEQEQVRRLREAELARLDDELLGLRQAMQVAQSAAAAENERFALLRQECVERLDAAERELHQVQSRRADQEASLQEAIAQQEERRAALFQLEDQLAHGRAKLEALAQAKGEGESALRDIAAARLDYLAQRDLVLRECEAARAQLAESAVRLDTLRQLVEARELDLAALQNARLEGLTQYEDECHRRESESTIANVRIREAIESLARLTQEIQTVQTSLQELRAADSRESVRLSATRSELTAHLARKQEELSVLEMSLERGRRSLTEFTAEREARQLEVTQRLNQALTKRKVAEDDLATKLLQLEDLNAQISTASGVMIELALATTERDRLTGELTGTHERLLQAQSAEQALNKRLADLSAEDERLATIQAQIVAREEKLQHHESRQAELEQRCAQLARSSALEHGTIQVLAQELILELDAVEEEIARCRRFDTGADAAQQLERLRTSLLALLARHGVNPFHYAEGDRLGAETRDRIEIIDSRSERCREVIKVIETIRPGYLHVGPDGETILRRAHVVTSNL
jgi:chromosome segregation ATPase